MPKKPAKSPAGNKKGQAKPPAAAEQSPQPKPPSWPPLTPVLPPDDLTVRTLLPGQILTIPNFFTASLCKTYVSFLQKSVSLQTTPGVPKRGEAVRVNDRFQIHDAAFAERLWRDSGLAEIVSRTASEGGGGGDGDAGHLWGGEPLGLNPNIRIYRYGTGQFFDKHYDDSNTLTFAGAPARTTWTLLVYLTGAADGVRGGETVFYTEATKKRPGEEIVASLERGTALLHKHGRDCLLHEGRLVEEDGGVGKWVLRSDLVVRR